MTNKAINNKRALVIGAGIHGSSVAIELARNNYVVNIIDAQPGLLMGSSGATHNRVHLGYHYPRSMSTALECKRGHEYFEKNFGATIQYPDFYYVIEKNGSKVSSQKYRQFVKKLGIEYRESWPNKSFLHDRAIDASFKVKEGYFDILKLREIISERFGDYGIKAHFNFPLSRTEYMNDGTLKLYSPENNILEIKANVIVNATYTNTNNIQEMFGLKDNLTEYEFENTEVAVVGCDYTIPALTVTDGPFITVLPYGGHTGKYLVYDAIHSISSRSYGIHYTPPKSKKSKWPLMLKHGLNYYPFFNDLNYHYSLWANRPIPLEKAAQNDDSRTTRIIKHNYPVSFYSILEGKLVSAPMIAEDLVQRIENDENV